MTPWLAEPLAITAQIGAVLDALSVRYLVGGSLASSLLGLPRATQDVDVVAELEAIHQAPLVAALESNFYLSDTAVQDAIRGGSSFNAIHLETMFKVDVFVSTRTPMLVSEMARRRWIEVSGFRLPVASPEDVVLQKLLWYRKGGGVSERQITDIRGVIRVSGPALERGYIEDWVRRLRLEPEWAEVSGP